MSKQNGKVAVITGATGGIGFQVAKRLGQDGYTVILNGIEDEVGAKRVGESLTVSMAARQSFRGRGGASPLVIMSINQYVFDCSIMKLMFYFPTLIEF